LNDAGFFSSWLSRSSVHIHRYHGLVVATRKAADMAFRFDAAIAARLPRPT
jgi:hypothetical protein